VASSSLRIRMRRKRINGGRRRKQLSFQQFIFEVILIGV